MAPKYTSQLLEDLVAQVPDGPVDLDWPLGHLEKRSFGLLLLMLGLLVIIPGVATVATLALLFPTAEMMLGRKAPIFPRLLSNDRSISSALRKWSRQRSVLSRE